MKRYHGAEKVAAGLYFNPRELAFTSIDADGCLPGTAEVEYRRTPALMLLIAGPILGAAYVLFLPVIGFAMLAWVSARKGGEIAAHAARAAIRVLEPSWEPTMAFLSRRKHASNAPEHKDTWAEGIKRKLEETDDEHVG